MAVLTRSGEGEAAGEFEARKSKLLQLEGRRRAATRDEPERVMHEATLLLLAHFSRSPVVLPLSRARIGWILSSEVLSFGRGGEVAARAAGEGDAAITRRGDSHTRSSR
jgi:hypothetical protein